MSSEIRHQCFIYDGEPSRQLSTMAAIMQRRLNEGYRCLYLNSRRMTTSMRNSLSARGVDVENEIAKTRLVFSSEPLTSTDGSFDVDSMMNKLEDALDQALNDGHKGLWASGDMTWEFGDEKNFEKLTEYEWRLESLFRKRETLCGICQYHHGSLPREVTRQGLLTHRSIFINESQSRINPHYLSSRLQGAQPTTSLELDETIAALCQLQKRKR